MLTEIEGAGLTPALASQTQFHLTALRADAEAGDRRAQYCLGVAYEEGRGVPANAHQAVKWYRHAAEQNEPAAQLALGVACAIGEGVERDYAQAYVWFTRSALLGNAEAAELRDLVARELGHAACAEALQGNPAAGPALTM